MAEIIGSTAAALQLATQGIALVDFAIRMKSCTLTLEQYQERIETLRALCLDVQSNPAFENTKAIAAQTQSILDTIEHKDLSSMRNKSRLRRTFAFIRNEKALLEHFSTLQDKKSTLSLQVQIVNSRALHYMCFGSMESKDETLQSHGRPHEADRTQAEFAKSPTSSSMIPASIRPPSQQQREDRRGPSQNHRCVDPSDRRSLIRASDREQSPSQAYRVPENIPRAGSRCIEGATSTQESDRGSGGQHQGIQVFHNIVEGHADQNCGLRLRGNFGPQNMPNSQIVDFNGAVVQGNQLVGTGEQNGGVSIRTTNSEFNVLPVPTGVRSTHNVLRVVGNSESSQNSESCQNFGTTIYYE